MRELVDLLIRSQVPFMIIGGHALGLHGAQRDTVDLDCVVMAERREEMKTFLESRGFEETARHATFTRYQHRPLLYPLLDVMQVDDSRTAGWLGYRAPDARQSRGRLGRAVAQPLRALSIGATVCYV